jgi:DNA polymerase-1
MLRYLTLLRRAGTPARAPEALAMPHGEDAPHPAALPPPAEHAATAAEDAPLFPAPVGVSSRPRSVPVIADDYRLVTERAGLEEVLAEVAHAPHVALDIETTGLCPREDHLRLLTLATPRGCWIVDCFAVDPQPLMAVLPQACLVGHNLLFDLGFLAREGLDAARVGDTLLLARLLSTGLEEAEGRGYHTLASVVERELGLCLPKELQQSDWSGALTREQLAYAARDAAVLLPLHERLTRPIRAAGLERIAEIENRCLLAVVGMSAAGVPFDGAAWEALAAAAEAETAALATALNALAPPPPSQLDLEQGWRWDSPAEALQALRAAGCVLEDTGDASLAACDHPLAEQLRRYRAARKRVTGYGREWLAHLRDGRIYPQWVPLGPQAGRMACRRPIVVNLHLDAC